jgi:polysaccharide deacetylase 2 family uncharacterized protein YibQ
MSVRSRFARSWFLLLLTAAVPAAAGPAGHPPPQAHAVARTQTQLQLAPAPARRPPPSRAQVAIIIDDLGEQHGPGLRAIELPGAVAVAFLPNGAFTRVQADYAHRRGKEILLHLPLQPGNGARAHPAALRVDSAPEQMREVLRAALDAVPHASGVNNHQGSLMTERSGPMDELMRELALRPGIYFVDSRTSGSSVAYRAARAHGVPSTERNVFLDTLRGEAAVRQAFEELVVKALRNERALAIGHPYPETLKVLAEELPKLERYGIRLVTPSELIARQSGLRGPYRPLKLSPALTLATTPALPGHPAATSSLAH